MPRFAANLTMLFQEVPMLERFELAKEAGFDVVEILFPYEEPGQDIRSALIRHDLSLCLINCPPPNYNGGARGFAAVPGGEDRFRYDFKRALRYASLLKPTFIHIMSGEAEQGDAAHQTLVENLRWACAEAPEQSLTIEPINTDDLPGYYLCDFDHAVAVLDEVGAPNLGLQFDAYHAHKITGDTMALWDRLGSRAVHVQVSAAEGRHEPVKGAIDYPAFFDRLDRDGYAGVVSAEYHPAGRTSDGLGWLP
ncbi:hydroxypyruvate isomerase family protein [Roseovarius sp. 2305UL8-3]|uniref:hydroxypyruvate isomerase family protein n=1 Tax=Roseovarius conchicola TaxID=3121636 RepID=UPI0035288F75